MQFVEFDHGMIVRKGTEHHTSRILRLVIGNPLIMKEMAKHVPDAGSYAPVTVLLDERADGVYLSYDRMASLLAPYGSRHAMTVARDLDAKVQDLLQKAAGCARCSSEGTMTAHIVRASFKDEICDSLASFTQDAEHSLGAVYHCFQEIYGDRAARCAAEAWLRILEERLEEPGELPKLTAITSAAIAFSVSNLIRPSAEAGTYFGATVA